MPYHYLVTLYMYNLSSRSKNINILMSSPMRMRTPNEPGLIYRTILDVWSGTWKQLHFRKSRMCTSANRVCASPQIPDVHVCTSANRVCASPQIPDVHVCTSANREYARHDSRDLPGHRSRKIKPASLHTFRPSFFELHA